MLISASHVTRTPPAEPAGMPGAPRVAGDAGHPVLDNPETRGARWRRRMPGASFSIVLHTAVSLAFVYLWHHMVRDLSTPEGIPVEIVSSVPGEGEKAKPAPDAEEKTSEATPEAAAPVPPPASQPAPDPLKQALAMPAPPPDDPTPAAPPPGDRTDQDKLRPVLAEPPPEPKAAATQKERNEKANTSEETVKPPTPAAAIPPPPAPEVLTTATSETSVAPSPHDPDHADPQKPSTPETTTADAGATMAAALPLSSLGLPSSFRAMLSSQGSSASPEYKGSVYGALSRVRAAMQSEAQRRRMKGQVVVLIAVADSGALEKATVIQSSGSAETDAFALDMVRRAAPFPPPPPGTSRSFTPAITFGDE